MLTEQEEQVVDHVVAELTQAFPVQLIILFGSRARGEATENSDYDFLVVVDTDQRRTQVAVDIRKTAHIPRIPMDFLVRSSQEWKAGFLLKKEIIAEGKILYEATNPGMDAQGTHGSSLGQGTV